MSKKDIDSLVARLEEAQHAYHNGLPQLMTDDQYDALVDTLTEMAPTHPFLTKVGAPIAAGDEVVLPIPLPSLNKAKPGGDLPKWLAKNPAATYMLSAKLDGCSALWIPATRQLFTRGDGTKGRNVSAFVPYFVGFPKEAEVSAGIDAIRGELIMRTDSPAVPAGKLARNIVAGILNRKEIDPTLFREIRFIAYELVEPATMEPKAANVALKAAGYETARATIVKAVDMTEAHLSAVFDAAEKASPYQMDGIVIAPCVARGSRPSGLSNPTDRVAWKQRGQVQSRRTTVREVEWNVSASGYLIPRVLFDEVEVGGARIHAATGLHGRWIHDNVVGPGAEIEIRRAGDTIPQIIAVHTPAPAGPSMPPAYDWIPGQTIHIRPSASANTTDLQLIRIVHALGELRAEHVGPGMVAKLYAAGFKSVGAIYAASPEAIAARVEGCKGKMASKIFDGLRVGEPSWTELDFMAASSTMPRTVGRTKLAILLSMDPLPTRWPTSLPGKTIPGISQDTIMQIIEALPAYHMWRQENLSALPPPSSSPSTAAVVAPSGRIIVMTGFRDKALEDILTGRGDAIGASVTKKTTAVVYPDGDEPSSGKITKAKDLGIPVLPVTEFRKMFLT